MATNDTLVVTAPANQPVEASTLLVTANGTQTALGEHLVHLKGLIGQSTTHTVTIPAPVPAPAANVLLNLPTADPHMAGHLWSDNGFLRVSQG